MSRTGVGSDPELRTCLSLCPSIRPSVSGGKGSPGEIKTSPGDPGQKGEKGLSGNPGPEGETGSPLGLGFKLKTKQSVKIYCYKSMVTLSM